ncbi:MAG: hypothetical protein AAGI37_18215 [Planctomycetota bacterium]
MATTLETAREVAEVVLRLTSSEVASGSNELKRLDYCIKAAGDEFVRRTRCTQASGVINATVDSEDLDTSALTGFRAGNVIRVTATHPTTGRVYIVPHNDFANVQTDVSLNDYLTEQFPFVNVGGFGYVPLSIAWRDNDSAIIYPIPSVAWSIQLDYWEPFTSWAIGTATPSSVTLNIPDEFIQGVLQHGVPAYKEADAPDDKRFVSSQRRFEAHINQCRGRLATTQVVLANEKEYP